MGYISEFRKKIGHDKFIHPAARIIIENGDEEILVIERADNNKIGLPAGGLEWNETIEECIRREVKEETGIIIKKLNVIGISSNPLNETVEYPNGDAIQYFTIEFYTKDWKGEIKVTDTKEIKSARFVKPNKLSGISPNEQSAIESLRFYKSNNKIMVK